jgi:hypothetical protein
MQLNTNRPHNKHNKLFKVLRGVMMANDMQVPDIAVLIGRSVPHVSRCLNNKAQFMLSEQYVILRRFNRPKEDLHKVFPENGIDIIPCEPGKRYEEVHCQKHFYTVSDYF